jgi:hypothetical protein
MSTEFEKDPSNCITTFTFTSDGNDAEDQVTFISFPQTVASIAPGLLDPFTALEHVVVWEGFDLSSLPDGLSYTVLQD